MNRTERTLTFTMEDALISTTGLLILTGAGLIEATNDKPIQVHVTETVEKPKEATDPITLKYVPSDADGAMVYVFPLKNGEIFTEPYIGKVIKEQASDGVETEDVTNTNQIEINHIDYVNYSYNPTDWEGVSDNGDFYQADAFLVDYYRDAKAKAQQIEITPDKFGGNYYLEASTLFRDKNGTDMPAEFIIPNCKVQSNFTFTMASSGDPSEQMRMAA